MGVVFGVAGVTILRGIDEDQVLVAGVALQTDVLTGQREWGSRMVKSRRGPSIGGMALTTVLAQRRLVGVILSMA